MDLQHAINDLKYVERFMKSLAKVIGTLEIVDGLEKREIEMNVIIANLLKKQTAITEAVETSNKMLHERQKNNKQEMAKIDTNIQTEKTAIINQYDIEISKRKEDLLLLQGRSGSITLEIKNLEKEKAGLEKKVKNLKKVVADTDSVVSSVG